MSPSGEGLGENRADFAGDPHRLQAVGTDEQHSELVAAEAGEQVTVAQLRIQPDADVDQKLVADLMAEAVVDLLKLVQVKQQHRGGRRSAELRLDVGVEGSAVRQASEVVGRGLPAKVSQAPLVAECQLGAPGGRQDGQRGQDHGDGWDVRHGAGDEHREARRDREGRDGECSWLLGAPGLFGARGLRFPGGMARPQRHQRQPHSPERVQRGPDHVAAACDLQVVDDVGAGEQPEAGQQRQPGPRQP